MSKNLVIVESPAKAKTIEKYLGKDYVVASSYGHIADLPSKDIGVDIENNFKPNYEVSEDKKAVVSKLKTLAKKSETVWLASDEDREGEAIAWHLFEQLNLKEANTKRIVFNEITKKAILRAVENPRNIDYNLVNAQQARRILDRLVGYKLSPVLWRKVKGGLSAGRVQSVAVRIIVERERAIQDFKPVASYKIIGEFITKEKKKFNASLPTNLKQKKEAHEFLEDCKESNFKVIDLTQKPTKKSPAAPFTTSTLQQEASRKLSFPVSKTMMMAQRLYEAGLITYMRTDSVNLSNDAIDDAAGVISKKYGDNYSNPRKFNTKSKNAQEAHEAIRPTQMGKQSVQIEYDQDRLYDLIWKRTVASQMADAQLERTNVKIEASKNKAVFTASGEVIKFDGFLKVYLEGNDDEDDEQSGMLPKLTVGDVLSFNNISATERFTKPPFRFSEASLVKRLEELSIGRPSTYAPTISTIQRRKYIDKGTSEGVDRNFCKITLRNEKITEEQLTEKVGADKGKLVPTDIGNVVNDFLVANFKDILDFTFTARVEEEFDEIATGKEQWDVMIGEFYKKFDPLVAHVSENAARATGERLLGKDPESGKNVYARLGKFGPMIQIGEVSDEEKPKFASLQGEQTLSSVTYEEAMDLFKLPKTLGAYEQEQVIIAIGRYGPYVKFKEGFISIPNGEDPMSLSIERAIELIEEKRKQDAPVAEYEGMPVQKAVGRFGPYLKWNNLFINVNKKYDFDNLSNQDIVELIEDKKKKEIEKVVCNWEEENLRVEKARWGRYSVFKGSKKVAELPKTTDVEKLTLEEVRKMAETKKKGKK